MLLFLYGEDTFRSLAKLREIKKGYGQKNESGLNLKEIDLEKEDFSSVRDGFRSRSMFSEKKLFIVRNPFSDPEFKKSFLREKEKFLSSQNILVFFKRGEVQKKDPLFKFLKKEAKVQEFSPLEEKETKNWVRKEAREYGLDISFSNTRLLLKRAGTDLWALQALIQKMAAFKDAKREKTKEVTRKNILSLTKPALEKDIFKTVDAIAEGKKHKALNLLSSHIKEGDSPFYILSMIAWQVTRLLAVKQKMEKGEDPQSLDWHPYVIKKSSRLCQKFGFRSLKNIHNKILDLDVGCKTGKISPQFALDLLVAEIRPLT